MKKDIYRKDLYNLITKIEVLNESLLKDLHIGFSKNNKTAMRRARVNTIQLTKLFKELRKITIEDEKRSKESK